jgi:polysaccharide biosynthesis/export protein
MRLSRPESSPALASLLVLLGASSGAAQPGPAPTPKTLLTRPAAPDPAEYILGPGDEIAIWALGVEEISQRPIQVQGSGTIDIPLLGQMKAAGLTVQELKVQLLERLKREVKSPEAVITVTGYHSQPVSVLGAVNHPGVHQLQGAKTLMEALSLAEGPRSDAGSTITVTRRLSRGRIPLPNAVEDKTGEFSVVELNLAALMGGHNPEENINLLPNDVITVSRGQIVYVLGEVRKTGGFVLGNNDTLSVLQAVSLAEGLSKTASSHKAKIFRASQGEKKREQIPVDIGRILEGKHDDVALRADDILYVPTNKGGAIAMRAAETLLSVAAGVTIWRVGVPR